MVNHACMPARADRAAASTPTAHSLAYARFVPSFARRRRSRQRRNIREHSSTPCRHRRISHLLARQSSTPQHCDRPHWRDECQQRWCCRPRLAAPPVEVRVEFHKFVLGPELPATFEVRAMEDPSERQAITCRVVSRGGVVPYEALIVGVHADGLCFDAQKTDATEFRSILFRSTNKCIEQQVLLNEERERIGTIVGRNKSLNVKNLTQEVLSLRKELDVTKHNAKAAMWKLQELHVVNKVLSKKGKETSEHVATLEEGFQRLQQTFRTTVLDSLDADAHLNDRIRSLEAI